VALNKRDPNTGDVPATGFPIARSFAGVILVALIVLIVLRHLFGSIRLEVGAR
jgi:hypothetical protein